MLTTNYCNIVQVHWAAELACYNKYVVDIVAHHRSNLNTWSQHPKYLILGISHLMHKNPKYLISSHLMEEEDRVEFKIIVQDIYRSSHLGCEQCLELCSHDREVSSKSKSQWSLLLQSDKPSCLPCFFFGSLVNLLSLVSFVVCLMSLEFFAA